MNKKHLILITALLAFVTRVNSSLDTIRDFAITLRECDPYNGLTTEEFEKTVLKIYRKYLFRKQPELIVETSTLHIRTDIYLINKEQLITDLINNNITIDKLDFLIERRKEQQPYTIINNIETLFENYYKF